MKKSEKYTVDLESQRQRILAWLRIHHTLTTLQAREELDVLHPAGRVMELRKKGHNIITHWTVEDTAKGAHRVARYVLLAGG